jgi:hypothetical protein
MKMLGGLISATEVALTDPRFAICSASALQAPGGTEFYFGTAPVDSPLRMSVASFLLVALLVASEVDFAAE